jgi:hypothetical protein
MTENENPTDHTRTVPGRNTWHDTERLPDGTLVGKAGALWYILDNNQNAISKGYHEMHVHGNGYRGKVDARWEMIELNGGPDIQDDPREVNDE